MTLFSTVLPTSPGLPQGSLSRLVILAFCSISFFASVQNVSSTSAIVCFLFFENPAKKRWHTSTTNRGCISLCCKSMAAMLHDTVVAMRTHPRAILLAMITMRKSIHGFPLIFIYGMFMGLCLVALWAAGAPLQYWSVNLKDTWFRNVLSHVLIHKGGVTDLKLILAIDVLLGAHWCWFNLRLLFNRSPFHGRAWKLPQIPFE